MPRIRARHKGRKRIRIHNDLASAAFRLKQDIEAKLAKDDGTGIAYNYMALQVMTAFTFEAYINFVGAELFQDAWNEREKFHKKVARVFEKAGIPYDKAKRPCSSVEDLKIFRDLVAHGKPRIETFEEIIIAEAEDIDRHTPVLSGWEPYCTHENAFNTYEDVDELWKLLLKATGIDYFETTTGGDGSLEYLGEVDD